MAAIASLELEHLEGDLPTYYSPGARTRAAYLQALLGGELHFYSSEFEVRLTPVNLAVLDSDQWQAIAGDIPYGMPSIEGRDPPVFVMPSTWSSVSWIRFPSRSLVPAGILRKVLTNGRSWSDVQFEGCDGIGTHEIGHSITRELGIEPHTHWFSEFLASYVGYTYLKLKHPHEALSSEIFWTQGLDAPHGMTSLADFESHYDELMQSHPANYAWYQLALDQRVIELYRTAGGVAFLHTVRSRFRIGQPRLDTPRLLDRLEQITPGWKRWAADLEAGKVRSARL